MSSSSNTKKKGGKPLTSYRQVMAAAAKPVGERKPLPIGKDGTKVVPRRFHLLPGEIKEMRHEFEAAGQGAVPNPYRGVYGAIVESLLTLGVNEVHDFPTVKVEVQSILSDAKTRKGEGAKTSTAWERFAGKEARNGQTGKDVDGRLLQNAEVLQRLSGMTPYGLKLLQVGREVLKTKGMVIDVLDLGGGKAGLRLNTDSATPVNERPRGHAVAPAEPAKGVKGKPGKGGPAAKAKHAGTKAQKPKLKAAKPKPPKAKPGPAVPLAGAAPAAGDAGGQAGGDGASAEG